MVYKNWMNDITLIESDWPLSLGGLIKFASCNKNFVKSKFYKKKSLIKKALRDEDKDVNGMAAWWRKSNYMMIAILYKGDDYKRFIEIVVHETSHVVDYILEAVKIDDADTELRAYLNDWIVGKILDTTDLNSIKKEDENEHKIKNDESS